MTPTYNAATLKALRASIKHWWENWSGAKPFSIGINYCALCSKFNDRHNPKPCIGCPVKDTTGRLWCLGTPYIQITNSPLTRQAFSPESKDELDFLISIYEKATNTKLHYTAKKPPTKTRTTLSRPNQPKPLLENSPGPSN